MSATKKTVDPKTALAKFFSSIANMLTDGFLDGLLGAPSTGVDLNLYTSVYGDIARRSGNAKKIDIMGAKGNAFAGALLEYLAKCYIEHGGWGNANVAAIRNYCDRFIPKFAEYYIEFDKHPTLKVIKPQVEEVANYFSLSASDNKDEAYLAAKYCCGFIHDTFMRNCYIHATQIKQIGYPHLIKRFGDDGLFDTAPQLREVMFSIVALIFTASAKGGAKGKKTSQPTDNSAQTTTDQSSNLSDLVKTINDGIDTDLS